MTKYILNQNDLLEQLERQIVFIITSAQAYDNGFEDESIRIATCMRILFHNSSTSSALLAQLHILDSLYFYNSASRFVPNNLLPFSGLTQMKITGGANKPTGVSFTIDLKSGNIAPNQTNGGKSDAASYVAPLDNLPPPRMEIMSTKLGFVRWWDRDIVIRDTCGNIFTRNKLVRTLCDKEGGTHVDPKLDDAYAQLSRNNSMGWKVHQGDKNMDFQNSPVMPSVRQIAHELIKTLEDNAQGIFPKRELILQKFKNYDIWCKTLSAHPN